MRHKLRLGGRFLQPELGRAAWGRNVGVTFPQGLAVRMGKTGFLTVCCPRGSVLEQIQTGCSEILECAPLLSSWLLAPVGREQLTPNV